MALLFATFSLLSFSFLIPPVVGVLGMSIFTQVVSSKHAKLVLNRFRKRCGTYKHTYNDFYLYKIFQVLLNVSNENLSSSLMYSIKRQSF